MDRITAIHKSLTVFVCGLVGFLPIIGLVPAIVALRGWVQVGVQFRKQWNPAATYLSWGARLAALGVLASILLVAMAILTFFGAFN